MKRNSTLLYVTALAVVPGAAQAQNWITAASSATSYYGGSLVNFTNNSSSDLMLTGKFDLNLSGSGGSANSYQIYTKTSALSGLETDASVWSLLGTGNVASSNPQGTFTTIDVGNSLVVSAGQTIGVAIFISTPYDTSGNAPANGFIGYRSGANTYTDGVATITTGLAKGYRGGFDSAVDQLFNVDTFSPRSWSGQIQYAAVPEPTTLACMGLFSLSLLARRKRKS